MERVQIIRGQMQEAFRILAFPSFFIFLAGRLASVPFFLISYLIPSTPGLLRVPPFLTSLFPNHLHLFLISVPSSSANKQKISQLDPRRTHKSFVGCMNI